MLNIRWFLFFRILFICFWVFIFTSSLCSFFLLCMLCRCFLSVFLKPFADYQNYKKTSCHCHIICSNQVLLLLFFFSFAYFSLSKQQSHLCCTPITLISIVRRWEDVIWLAQWHLWKGVSLFIEIKNDVALNTKLNVEEIFYLENIIYLMECKFSIHFLFIFLWKTISKQKKNLKI